MDADLSQSDPDPSVFFEASLEGTGDFDDGYSSGSATFTASQSSQIGSNAIDLLLDSDRLACTPPCASPFGQSSSSSTFDLVFELDLPSVLSFSTSAAGFAENDGAPLPFVFSSDGLMDLNGTVTHLETRSSSGIVYDISDETSAIEGWTANDSLVIWEISGTVPAGMYELSSQNLTLTQDVFGGTLDMSIAFSPVPEPSSIRLAALGLVGIAAVRRRRR